MIVVVDSSRETIYGPFDNWKDAEWFSNNYSLGAWAVIYLTIPNEVKPETKVAFDPTIQYSRTGHSVASFTRE